MRVGTIASLVASAALGLGALLVARVWLPSQSAKAQTGPQGSAGGVPVVLAASPIAYGTKLEAKYLTVARLPADAAPPGAFSSVEQVLKQDAGGAPVALQPIALHEAVLAAKLSGAGAKPTLAALIGPGFRAYTIGVTEVAGGGGHVMPADRVDVLLTRDASNGDSAQDRDGRLTAEVVIQNVRVLGMDLNVDPNSTHPAVAHTATLEVNVEDAEKLALAGKAGTLSLALRRTGAAEIEPVRPVLTGDLGPPGPRPASVPTIKVRRLGSGRGHPAPASASSAGTVIVVHGEHSASVAVPAERIAAG